MEWRVLKSGSDTEREHLNKILKEIRAEATALSATDSSLQSQIDSFVGDPWTYVTLGSNFTHATSTYTNVTGMSFTPAANTKYEFEAKLILASNSASIAIRPGLTWPTGLTDGVANFLIPQTASTDVVSYGNSSTDITSNTAIQNTINPFLCTIDGLLITGATPSGDVQLRIANEDNATTVTVKAGSFIKYRTI